MTVIDRLLLIIRSLAYLVPFVVLACGNELIFPDALFPNVVWKHALFRGLVEVMFALWLVVAWADPRYRPRRSPLLVAYGVFVLGLLLADVCGLRPAYSLWGSYERMEGLLGHGHLFAFFLITGTVLDRAEHWRTFFRVSIGVAVIVSLFAMRQIWLAIELANGTWEGRPFMQPIPEASLDRVYLRADARLGSPVFLAIYMQFHAFLAVWAALRSAGAWRKVFGAAAALFVVVLFLTGSRISYFGIVAGGAVALTLLGVTSQDDAVRRRSRRALIAVGVMVAVASIFVIWKPPFLSQIPLVRRLFGLDLGAAVAARLHLWGMAWDAFLAHPILGWGQENFGYVFHEFYRPELYSRELPDWWDHPHNGFLVWLTAGGLVVFVPYLAIWATGLRMVWRSAEPSVEKCLWVGMLVGYAAFMMAQPDNLASYLLFFATLACVHARGTAVREPAEASVTVAPGTVYGVAGVAVAISLGAFHVLNLAAIAPGVSAARAFQAVHAVGPDGESMFDDRGRVLRDAPTAITHFRESLATAGPMGQSQIRHQLCRQAGALLSSSLVSPADKQTMVDMVNSEMRDEVASNPGNCHDLFNYGWFLGGIQQFSEADRLLTEALDGSPNRQLFLYAVATARYQLNRRQEASDLIRKAYEVHPASKKARVQSCVEAIYIGDDQLMNEMLDVIRSETRTKVFRVDERIVQALFQVRRFDLVIEMLEPIIEEWNARLEAGVPPRRNAIVRYQQLLGAYSATQRTAEAAELQRVIRKYGLKPEPR